MSHDPVVSTPHHTPLSSEEGFTPVSTTDEGHGTLPVEESLSGRHADPDLQPDGYREDTSSEVLHDETHHDVDRPVEGEGLGEHKPGESFKEWIAADIQQTKEDLHLGGHKKD